MFSWVLKSLHTKETSLSNEKRSGIRHRLNAPLSLSSIYLRASQVFQEALFLDMAFQNHCCSSLGLTIPTNAEDVTKA